MLVTVRGQCLPSAAPNTTSGACEKVRQQQNPLWDASASGPLGKTNRASGPPTTSAFKSEEQVRVNQLLKSPWGKAGASACPGGLSLGAATTHPLLRRHYSGPAPGLLFVFLSH